MFVCLSIIFLVFYTKAQHRDKLEIESLIRVENSKSVGARRDIDKFLLKNIKDRQDGTVLRLAQMRQQIL